MIKFLPKSISVVRSPVGAIKLKRSMNIVEPKTIFGATEGQRLFVEKALNAKNIFLFSKLSCLYNALQAKILSFSVVQERHVQLVD